MSGTTTHPVRRAAAALFAAAAVAGAVPATGALAAAPGVPSYFGALVGDASARCLTVPATASGSATIGDCDEGATGRVPASQTWYLDGQQIRSRVSGGCLTVLAGGTANGSPVGVADCAGLASQKWVSVTGNTGPDLGTVANPASKRCLDVAKKATAAGSPVQLWDCTARSNQLWSTNVFTETTAPSPRVVDVVGVASGKCPTPTATTLGSPVALADCDGAADRAQFVVDTYRRLGAVGLTRCLVPSGTANGSAVVLAACSGASTWTRTPNGALADDRSDRCLDVVKKGTATGSRLQIWDCAGRAATNQLWTYPTPTG